MRRLILAVAAVALLLGFSITPAVAQTSVTLTSSAQDIIFATGSTANSLTVQLGNCIIGFPTCTQAVLSGSATGTAAGSAVTNFSIITGGLIPLTTNGSGTWSASAASLVGSSMTLTGTSGTLFSGTLSSLSFSESPTATNGLVTMLGTAVGTGASAGVTLSFNADIQLPTGIGANINTVANSSPPTNVSGRITVIPEPASMFLFGSGLVMVGAVLRRRRIV